MSFNVMIADLSFEYCCGAYSSVFSNSWLFSGMPFPMQFADQWGK